jgi:hypothetical protein
MLTLIFKIYIISNKILYINKLANPCLAFVWLFSFLSLYVSFSLSLSLSPPLPYRRKSLVQINLTPAEEDLKRQKSEKCFPPYIWRLDFYKVEDYVPV